MVAHGNVFLNGRKTDRASAQVRVGDTITFKGKTFRVEPAANNNVKLVEVA